MKTCGQCHISLSVSSFHKRTLSKDGLCSKCKTCSTAYKREYHKKNKAKKAKIDSEYYTKNKSRIKNRMLNNYYKDPEAKIVYRKNNAEKIRVKRLAHNRANKGLCNSYSAKRRAARSNATPNWLTKDHISDILQMYEDAKDIEWLSEESFEVDHIVPLRGKNVCGLHVPWNLQILTRFENRSKGNRF